MKRCLSIGNTAIHYTLRMSARAKRKRIVVTPEGVEVIIPEGTTVDGNDGVLAFLDSKRRWLFDAVREVEEKHLRLLTQQYASGAKLQYRGRWLMLQVRAEPVEEVEIVCRSRFHVSVPQHLDETTRLESIQQAFEHWLKVRAMRDIRRFGKIHQRRLGVQATDFRLSEAKRNWGSCGKDGVIRIHWRLIQAPVAALEYVVAHEVSHLIERHHGKAFWNTVARTLPDWQERKAMLERWETEHRAV